MQELYRELILDHSKHPVGRESGAFIGLARLGSHREYNPSCGDEIELNVALDSVSPSLLQVWWQGDGCAISMASASIMTELLRELVDSGEGDVSGVRDRITAFRDLIQSRGAGAADEQLLGDALAFENVGKYVMRVKCAMLGWVALEAALRDAGV